IGSSDGKLYALDLQLSSTPKWEPFETGGKIWSTPAVDNGVVYIASTDHWLYAINAESGEEIWRFEAEAGILSTPVVYEGTVYIGANDNKFYAIDVNQEEKEAKAKWVFDGADNWFWTEALIYDSKIWVGNHDHNVYAINIENPEDYEVVLETEGIIYAPPVLVKVDDEKYMIVVGSEDGYLYTIDPEDTSTARLRNLEAPILAPICTDRENDGIIYVHAQNGEHVLYAINVVKTGQEWQYITSGD
ncbi:PQQ-binding-like beta-propeller repeat protein, partial [Chloroflexota bacterium]